MTDHIRNQLETLLVAMWLIGLISLENAHQTLNAASGITHAKVYFEKGRYGAVSYTHLTLPTIYSV